MAVEVLRDRQASAVVEVELVELLATLVDRVERFELPYAGGCDLGTRTVEPHMMALRPFGLKVVATEGSYHATAAAGVWSSPTLTFFKLAFGVGQRGAHGHQHEEDRPDHDGGVAAGRRGARGVDEEIPAARVVDEVLRRLDRRLGPGRRVAARDEAGVPDDGVLVRDRRDRPR